MKERPILFSGEMVRALLAGTKTQTRRTVKHQPGPSCLIEEGFEDESPFVYSALYGDGPGHEVHEARTPCICPYGQPGDRLWVRESFAHIYRDNSQPEFRHSEDVAYMADGLHPDPYVYGSWKPSIHMPRWASRITLEITDVRVQRLQDISSEDAIAEGIVHRTMNDPCIEYQHLWESINGAGSWDANPFVWVVEFKRVP